MRITLGPINRVEGDVEVTLDIEAGVVRAARVAAPLYRGFEEILLGRPAEDALAIVPRICGICSVSQSLAAAAVLRAAREAPAAANGLAAANVAHAAENIADHLTHFYLFFMPDFARDSYRGRSWFVATQQRFAAGAGTHLSATLPARARLLNTQGIIAGKWPHSLAFRPGGVTRALDLSAKLQLATIFAEFREFAESALFAAPLEEVAGLGDAAALARFAEGPAATGDFAAFLRIADDLRLRDLGRGPGLLMAAGAYAGAQGPQFPAGVFESATGAAGPLRIETVTEDVACAWYGDSPLDPAQAETRPDMERPGAYSFAKAPRLAGRAAEVGALARQAVAGHPLIRDLLRRDGASSVESRVVARLLEIALLVPAAQAWIAALRVDAPFCAADVATRDGDFVAQVEAARGTLGHWARYRDGRIDRYQIIAPTTWNFSPRDGAGMPGPLECALQGIAVGDAAADHVAVQHTIRSFDPCMVCTAH